MKASLIAAGIATRNANGDTIPQWDGGRVDIDFIGKIYGIVDGESVVIDSNYHANLRVCGDLSQDQLDKLPIIPAPTTPLRVFA